VEGNFKNAVPTPVNLYLLQEKGALLIDSVEVKEGNSFKLRGEAENPAIYLIKYFNGQSIYVVVHPGDNLKISIDNTTPEISYYLEGSADVKLLNELIRKQNIVLKNIDELSRKIAEKPDDIFVRTDVDFAYAKLLREHKMYTINFIHSHANSMVNIMALYQNFGLKTRSLFDRYEDVELFDFVDSNLIALYPGSESVKILDKQVAETKEQIRNKKYYESSVTEGRLFPSFQDTTIHGDTINFPSSAAKINILYFWASWNPYSYKELVMLDNLNRSNGNVINVLSVSLDSSPDKLIQTITPDSIKVPVICDYKYWDSEIVNRLSVRKVPTLFVINAEGLVIARDIYAADLKNKISEYIKGLK
jgi:thiol-disulfide isomerase/thioredoxin